MHPVGAQQVIVPARYTPNGELREGRFLRAIHPAQHELDPNILP